MDATTELLINLLARTDALFEPLRLSRHNLNLAAAIVERRDLYLRAGLPLTAGGSAADRQRHSRELAALREGGWLTTRGKTRPTVRLTDAGEHHLRALVGAYRVDESWELLELVATLVDAGAHNAGHALETHLLGTSYDAVVSSDLVGLEQRAAPLLARGWLDSAGDLEGRIGYAITPQGRAALTAGKPDRPADLPEYDPEAGDFYDEMLAAARIDRDTWVSERSNHVVVPLSCGLWPSRKPLNA